MINSLLRRFVAFSVWSGSHGRRRPCNHNSNTPDRLPSTHLDFTFARILNRLQTFSGVSQRPRGQYARKVLTFSPLRQFAMNSSSEMTLEKKRLLSMAIAVAVSVAFPAHAAELIQPRQLIVDASLPEAQSKAQILAARRYDTFWNTGEEQLAADALTPDFMDRTLPPGRAQGVQGPLAASKFVRTAIPDLSCEIEQMIVAGDRVVTHLHFHGHFTGRFKQAQGKGEVIDFIATDIYRVANGRIAENWHLEDNLALLQQLGQIAK
ncbi:ester cyclase [Bradyrhizobium guangzhouense]|nr:ester cyclase [Bradyrhizobium guangzhouense]